MYLVFLWPVFFSDEARLIGLTDSLVSLEPVLVSGYLVSNPDNGFGRAMLTLNLVTSFYCN